MTRIIMCGVMGAMGKTITKLCEESDSYVVIAGVDVKDSGAMRFPVFSSIEDIDKKADVIIDFSHPSCLKSILEYAKRTKTPAVIATTGLSEENFNDIKEASKSIALFQSQNMSLGINLLINLCKKATSVLQDTFDIEIVEKHHNQKIDAPSGTAIMLANAIKETKTTQTEFVYDRHLERKKRDKKEIGISSIRGGSVVGEHEVLFLGNNEFLELKHSATSKEVFAQGALAAANYIQKKKTGLYNMQDLVSNT